MAAFSKDFSERCFFRCHEVLVSNNRQILNSTLIEKTLESVDSEELFKQCDRCSFGTFSPIWYYFHKKKCNPNLNSSLRKPTKKITAFQCDHCNFEALYKNGINEHIKLEHTTTEFQTQYIGSEQTRKRSRTAKRALFSCDHCMYKTRYKRDLHRHQLRMHIEQQKLFRCTQCEYASSKNLYLKGHIMRMHTPTELQKRYYCDECDFKTIYNGNLRLHKHQKHPAKHQQCFKCIHCEYSTSSKVILSNHLRRKHRPKKSFQCEQCEFKTVFQHSLKEHIKRIHTPDEQHKVFRCMCCSYKAAKEVTLRKHIRKMHLDQVEWFSCDKCEFKTLLKRLLTAHEKIHMFFAQQKWDESDQYAFKKFK